MIYTHIASSKLFGETESKPAMTKVYPKAADACVLSERQKAAVVLTVWKKSLLPNCKGFTVFDGQGNLIFRVDNYVAAPNKHQTLLMDAAGKPLLTIRRKRLISLGENWVVFEGEDSRKPIFTARKHGNNKATMTQVVLNYEEEEEVGCGGMMKLNNKMKKKVVAAYEMEGSYAKRCCTVYNSKNKRKVAEIKRKEASGGIAFGTDVFRLIVYPDDDIDTSLAMTFVIILDQMFG